MKFKAVIFDMDGTLIDSMGIWENVDIEFLGKRNIEAPDNLFDDMESGNTFLEIAEYFKNKFDLPESPHEIMKEWSEMTAWHYANDIGLKPGVIELLDYLKQNKVKIGIGTSNTKELSEMCLKNNKVLSYFETLIAGCEDIKGKPFPDIFLKVAQNLGVKPEECLVLEDVHAGVRAAKNAGMTVFAIEDKYACKEKSLIMRDSDRYYKNYALLLEDIKKSII
ncbi:MAG: HAD family hydrolase [Candidatus Cloacimonadota bacterium]|nr:MAG: HAD family hydrolase [Candidatus Cloacimonadota bacterium]